MAGSERPVQEKLHRKLFWTPEIKQEYRDLTGASIPFRGKTALKNLQREVDKYSKDLTDNQKLIQHSKKRMKGASAADKKSIKDIEIGFYEEEIKHKKASIKAIKGLARKIEDHVGD